MLAREQPIARLPGRATTVALPRTLAVLVALSVGASFYVAIEPAPCDLLFLILCGALVVQQRWFTAPADINPLVFSAVMLFILGNLISLTVSLDFTASMIYMAVTLYMFAYWFVFMVVIRRFGVEMYVRVKQAFIFAAVVAAVVGLIQTLGLINGFEPWIHNKVGPRATSTFKDPNVYAPFLCVAFMLSLHDMIIARRSIVWTTLLLCLFGAGILGAFSRGAFVNLAVAFTLFAIIHVGMFRQVRLVKRLGAAALLLAAVVLPALLLYLDQAHLEQFFTQRLSLQEYDSKRFGTQSLALESIADHPFGIGPGQANEVFPIGTHNVYLQVVTENGVLGGLGFVLFLLAVLYRCFRGMVRAGPYRMLYGTWFAILGGIVVNSLVIDTLHWRHFFLLLALPIGLAAFERREQSLVRAQQAAFVPAIH